MITLSGVVFLFTGGALVTGGSLMQDWQQQAREKRRAAMSPEQRALDEAHDRIHGDW